ncbi:hypothetical protein ACFQ1L_41445 [Phytohabitans flavus]
MTWTDEVTGKHGYLVIDRLVRGAASGACGCARAARSTRCAISPAG